MDSTMEKSTLQKYGLTEGDCDRLVSDTDLQRISSSHCRLWRSLPAHLGVKIIMVETIDRGSGDEYDKKHSFSLRWKEIKGTGATYKQLITALFKIDCRLDAEGVCSILKDSISLESVSPSVAVDQPLDQQPSNTAIAGTTAASNGQIYK